MISNTPWLRSIEQFDDEAIASIAVRLAPMGRIDTDTLLRLHLGMLDQSVSTIATIPNAIAELAALGSFDIDRLSRGSWKIFKDRVEFLGCKFPSGWLVPERRRVAPGRLAADGPNARVRNAWLLSGMPCDIETGELLLDRCPRCLNLLSWWRIRHVWSCQICERDLRSIAPKPCPPETFAAVEELARFLFHHDSSLPAPLDGLPHVDILKLAAWLSHFRALPQDLFLAIAPKSTAAGFSQLKRWPHSFDEIVLERLGAPKYGDLTTMDAISRTKLAGGLMTSIDRLPSAKARELVRSRLMEVLGLQADFVEASHLVTEPVMSLPISSSGLDGRR